MAGMQCNHVARCCSIAAQIAAASLDSSATSSRARHCCKLSVHPAMWWSGNGHTAAPPRNASGPSCRAQHVDPMRQHHAFGWTCAPAREEDHVRIGLAQRRLVDGVVDLVGGERGQPVELEHGDAESRPEVDGGIAPRTIGHEQRGTGSFEHPCCFVGAECGSDRGEHRAELGERGERGYQVEARLAPHDDAVPVPDAQPSQAAGGLVGPGLDRPEGEGLAAERGGGMAGYRTSAIGEEVPDEKGRGRHRAPLFHESSHRCS